MGAGTSAEEFFLKSINVESIFEFVESKLSPLSRTF